MFFSKLFKKEKISELLSRYKLKLSEYQDDPYLSRIGITIIKDIEENMPSMKNDLLRLKDFVSEPFKLSFEENKLNLFTTYNEIHNMWYLKTQGLDISKIREKRYSNS